MVELRRRTRAPPLSLNPHGDEFSATNEPDRFDRGDRIDEALGGIKDDELDVATRLIAVKRRLRPLS
jgi:hypothetical protein